MLVRQGLLKEPWHLVTRAVVVAVRIAVGALCPVLESTRWRESWGAPCGRVSAHSSGVDDAITAQGMGRDTDQ